MYPQVASFGDVFLIHQAYQEGDTWMPKYAVLLSKSNGDFIYCLTTSRPHGRGTEPPCSGLPLAAYYLGIVPNIFSLPTWLDLLHSRDIAAADLEKKVTAARQRTRC